MRTWISLKDHLNVRKPLEQKLESEGNLYQKATALDRKNLRRKARIF
jgi:hypothetical protein